MLQHGPLVGVTEVRLRSIINHIKADIVKIGEKTVRKKSLVWSLIQKIFPDKNEDEKMEMLLKAVGPGPSDFVPDDIMDQALKSMPHDEVKSNFDGLRQRLDKKLIDQRFKEEVKRKVGERAEREHSTPDCIKRLRPNWKNCGICMDVGLKAFEAYYPAGKPTKSVSMKWEGPRGHEDRNKMAALSYCVDFLWKNHAEKKRVA